MTMTVESGRESIISCRICITQKIGMVGGPKENSDAMERKATFESALWKNGILPQEKRYVEGDLTGNAHSAYARLLDDNPDLEAVFCVNDETAAGLVIHGLVLFQHIIARIHFFLISPAKRIPDHQIGRKAYRRDFFSLHHPA